MSALGLYEHCKECICGKCWHSKTNCKPCLDCEGIPLSEAEYAGYALECERFIKNPIFESR